MKAPGFGGSHVYMGALEGIGDGVVLFGAPLDVTTSFRPGTRFGPRAIREQSYGLETYDLKTHRDLENLRYFDAGDLELAPGEIRGSLDAIFEAARKVFSAGGRPLIFGGEHLLSLAVIEAAAKAFPNLAVIHIDAHADMRSEYLGKEFTHAGVMRRVCEAIGRERVFSYGVRSASSDEIEYAMNPPENFHPHSLEKLANARDLFSKRPVYVTLDIDVVDPAYAPGTGAPEPGGVSSTELFLALGWLEGLNIVGADIVEVAPAFDPAGITAMLAAKIARQLILSMSSE